MLVSDRTYQAIRLENGHPPEMGATGFVGSLFSVDVIVDPLIENGRILLMDDAGGVIGFHSLEPTPAQPLDPYQRAASVKQVGTMWFVLDSKGEFLFEVTESGALKIRHLIRERTAESRRA